MWNTYVTPTIEKDNKTSQNYIVESLNLKSPIGVYIYF